MALPKAVQAQLDEADRLQKSITEPQEVPETQEVANEEVVEANEVVAEQTSQEPEPKAEPEQDVGYWKHRFDSLEGIYESKLNRANERADALENELQKLRNEFQQQQQATQEKVTSSLVTDEDVESFGNDLIDLQKRVAKQTYLEAKAEFDAERKQLEAKIAQLEGQLGGVNQQVSASNYDRFLGKVSQLVPDWEQVNTNQGFLKWLSEVDPLVGKPRQALMDEAAGAMDANRVSAIFNAYKSLVAPVKKSNSDLQRQVSPSKTASSSQNQQPKSSGKVWSQREIQQFYQDVAQGRIKGDVAAKLEAELNAAVVEGRVSM